MPSGAPDLPAPPLNEIVEGQEVYIVNECSGHTDWHDPDCGGCNKVELALGAVLIRNERVMWARAGMDTDHVGHDIWNIDVQVLTLIEAVEELFGEGGKDKVNEIYRRKYLEKLTEYRKLNEAEVRKMRMKAELGIAQSRIIGADGNPLN